MSLIILLALHALDFAGRIVDRLVADAEVGRACFGGYMGSSGILLSIVGLPGSLGVYC